LAVTISWKNKTLTEEEISYTVQQLIDRLIFIRIAEGRSVEPYGTLREATKKGNFYNNLFELFKKADEKYNSGLFSLRKDKISDSLIIDNKIIKDIIDQLYPPRSPFEFSVIPVEILGSAYERFLGKQIKVDFAHRATIEEKPEVRKAGGVYYTPQFVVDYIIEATVGAAIQNKKPSEINKLRIVDPACGSGSFLLGAYKCLLDYHKNYYFANIDSIKHDKHFPLTPDGNLTTNEKKRILLNNIYGVDIDVNAVEVTKLSLLIKCMEGETEASINQQLKIWHERILPTLENNIKSGNSIIDLDFYSDQIDFGEEKKINPFNWPNNFSEIFNKGGFDIVIGNPPYGADFSNPEKNYLINKFKNQNYQLDSYLIFLEHSVANLLKPNGLFGMIIPNPWLTNLLQKDLRKFIFSNTSVVEIVHFIKPVFPKVTVDTEIVILQNTIQKNNSARVTVVGKENFIQDLRNTRLFHKQKEWQNLQGDVINIFLTDEEKKLIKKVQQSTHTLDNYLDINVGIKPYQVGKGKPKQTKSDVESRIYDSNIKKDKHYRQYLRGSDINRYYLDNKTVRFIKYGEWLAEPRPAAKFDSDIKIFMRQTGDSLIAALDDQKLLCLNNMHVLVPKPNINEIELKFILGIINSRLLNWIYQNRNPEKGEALAEVKKTNVAQLPIKTLKSISDKTKNEISALVDQLLLLNKDLISAKIPSQIDQLKNKIDYLNKKIDNQVYQIYNLNLDEINLIEKN
jgi:type I restriction-modification system DNA methylase subunit